MIRSDSDLERSWSLLESRASDERWNALRLGIRTNGSEVLAAIDNRGLRHLLVPAQDKRYGVKSQGALEVEVGHRSFVFLDAGAEYGRFLDISCKSARLNEQFNLVIQSVLDSIPEASDGAESALFEVARWRQLFATLAASRRLTIDEKTGLFAELTVLCALTNLASFDPGWWTGPQRNPHDFELPSNCIEVKGCASDKKEVHIHGLKQLDNCDERPLVLVLVEVELAEEGETVGDLLENIVFGQESEHLIRQRAAMAGIFGSSDDSDRFVATQVWAGEVREGFPRITRSNVPDQSVRNVNYSLDAPSILPFMNAIRPEELSGFLSE